MWELDHKEDWALKNWCFWTVVLEKTLEGPLAWKEIQPVNPKGNQPWIFIRRTGAEAEILRLQYFEHLMRRANSLEKTLMLGERGEDGDRGWDGWTASPTQWTWVWTNSRRWWRTGKPGVLQSMGSQRVRRDLVTEWQWHQFHKINKTKGKRHFPAYFMSSTLIKLYTESTRGKNIHK